MKATFLTLTALFSFSTHASTSFSPGNWKMTEAGCSAPGYVHTPEEQAFIDAIRKGQIWDRYTFSDAANGMYETGYFLDKNASCIGRSTVYAEYISGTKVRLNYGATKWETKSTSQDTTITCSGAEEPSALDYGYRLDGDTLTLSLPAKEECGSYQFIFRRE